MVLYPGSPSTCGDVAMLPGDVLLGDGIFQATTTDAPTTEKVDISNGAEGNGREFQGVSNSKQFSFSLFLRHSGTPVMSS